METRDLLSEAEAYALRQGLELCGQLGDGAQGTVWAVRGKGNLIPWALKIHASVRDFRIERDCYLRLQDEGLCEIAGFHLPLLLRADEGHRALEMTIVTRPYVLDFAQTYLDSEPDFSADVWAEAHARWQRRYDDDAWPRVQSLLYALEAMGIYYLDVHPRNIAL